jgi:hypothetical protein
VLARRFKCISSLVIDLSVRYIANPLVSDMRGAGKIRYRVKAAVLVFCAFIFPVSVPGAEVTLSLDHVSRTVVFLHVPVSAGAGMIEIGTGFLVRIEDELFLVTAAHVAKLMDLRASMTLGDDGVLAKTYNIPFLIGKAAEPQWLLNPAADVAVLRLYLSDSLKKLIASRALPARTFLSESSKRRRERDLERLLATPWALE